MNGEPIAAFYDDVASEYDTRIVQEAHYAFPRIIPRLLRKQGIEEEKYEVLDLACGTGNVKKYTHFKNYIGVDISGAMLEQAAQAGYTQLIQADAATVLASLEDDSVDGVLFISAAYFLPSNELTELILQMRRVTRHFWLLTLDGITPALARIYQEQGGIAVYNHLDFPLPADTLHFRDEGWYASESKEEIPVEYCLGRT